MILYWCGLLERDPGPCYDTIIDRAEGGKGLEDNEKRGVLADDPEDGNTVRQCACYMKCIQVHIWIEEEKEAEEEVEENEEAVEEGVAEEEEIEGETIFRFSWCWKE